MGMTSHQKTGRALIAQLKTHIVKVLRNHSNRTAGVLIDDLQKATGLEILSVENKSIWDRAFTALVSELEKEGKVTTDLPPGSLPSMNWMHPRIWPVR